MRFSRLAVLLTLPVFGAYGADTQQTQASPPSDPQQDLSARSQGAGPSGQYAPAMPPPHAAPQWGGGGPGRGMMGGPAWGPPGMMMAPGMMQEGPTSLTPPELEEGDYPAAGLGGGYPGPGQGSGSGPMPGYGPPQGAPGPMMGGGMMRSPGAAPRMGRGMRGMDYVMHALSLPNLSNEQRDQVRKVAQDLRKKHWEIQGSMMDERDKLSELWSAESVDAAAIGDTYGRVCDLKRQMIQASIEAKNQVDKVLSAGQGMPQDQGQPDSPGAGAPSGQEKGSGGGSGAAGNTGG